MQVFDENGILIFDDGATDGIQTEYNRDAKTGKVIYSEWDDDVTPIQSVPQPITKKPNTWIGDDPLSPVNLKISNVLELFSDIGNNASNLASSTGHVITSISELSGFVAKNFTPIAIGAGLLFLYLNSEKGK